jgi:hypothetical protein
LRKEKLPYPCRVNNLALPCVHRYPDELKGLSPLEERLIGIYIPCGWITKVTIDLEKGTSGRYRRHIKGHIMPVPNDVQGLAANVLPHPLLEERERIHVCFVGPRKPAPQHLSFMLSVNPQKVKHALVWLKSHNDHYRSIEISEENLHSWGRPSPGSEVPTELYEQMVAQELRAEDEIRTGHYVSAAERGRPDAPIRTAEEVLTQLENRESDAARLEAESNTRLGAIHTGTLEPVDMEPSQVEEELCELTSTGLISTEMDGEHTPEERLHILRAAAADAGRRTRGRKPDSANKATSLAGSHAGLYILSRRGEELADSNDPDFFPKTFPCLFPSGRGGPRVRDNEEEGMRDTGPAGQDDTQGHKQTGFYLRPWARTLLQRHGMYRYYASPNLSCEYDLTV